MIRFLRAQAECPFDPAPMLIRADSLEESEEPAGAAVLRGLVRAGIPSLHALALGDASLFSSRVSTMGRAGHLGGRRWRRGWIRRLVGSEYGCGDQCGPALGYEDRHGRGCEDGIDSGGGCGVGDGHGAEDGEDEGGRGIDGYNKAAA